MAASVWSRLPEFVDSLVFTTIVWPNLLRTPPYIRPAQQLAGAQHARVRACAIMQQEISIPKRDIHTYQRKTRCEAGLVALH